MVKLIGSVFQGTGKAGDFGWMIAQPDYASAFFVFNDNETQWAAHRRDPRGIAGCQPGGGNAAIRPCQCESPPRALGIPTGDSGIPGGPGYPELTDHVKATIDAAVASIARAVNENGYAELYYSSDGQGGLGTSIFAPAPEVTAYIMDRLKSLEG